MSMMAVIVAPSSDAGRSLIRDRRPAEAPPPIPAKLRRRTAFGLQFRRESGVSRVFFEGRNRSV
jgi:hypothetical protein